MALSAEILALIRDEIGDDAETGVADDTTLEAIYTSTDRGNYSILVTALIVWRKRLANMQSRAFDVSKEGNWIARSQKAKFLATMVSKYERLLSDKPRGANATNKSQAEAAGLVTDTTELV